MYNVLVCDDDREIVEAIEIYLSQEGYKVLKAYDGEEALKVLDREKVDLLIIDVMMPKLDGLQVLRALRDRGISTPVLLLTAKSQVADRIAGLDSGADDYLTKPFAIEELLARMRVAFKHSEGSNIAKKTILQVQNLEIDTEKRMVTVDGKVVDLTKKEYELLTYLVQNKNIVLTREQILNEVWGYSYIGETNVVDVYIRYLRAKIDEAFGKKYILTIRGVGYYVKEE